MFDTHLITYFTKLDSNPCAVKDITMSILTSYGRQKNVLIYLSQLNTILLHVCSKDLKCFKKEVKKETDKR